MGAEEIRAFLAYLAYLATERDVAASTQNQALAAFLFLYRTVLKTTLPAINNIERAHKSARLPEVLTGEEVRAILAELNGATGLVAKILYGSGLRLLTALEIRCALRFSSTA